MQPEGWIAYLQMMELVKCVFKTKYSKYKGIKKYDKRNENLLIYILNTMGSNDKAIPKMICLAFRYNEVPVAP